MQAGDASALLRLELLNQVESWIINRRGFWLTGSRSALIQPIHELKSWQTGFRAEELNVNLLLNIPFYFLSLVKPGDLTRALLSL